MHSDESSSMMCSSDYACYDKSASEQDKLLWWTKHHSCHFALYYDIAESGLIAQLQGTCICGKPLHTFSHVQLCSAFIKQAHKLTIAKLEQKYDELYDTARH